MAGRYSIQCRLDSSFQVEPRLGEAFGWPRFSSQRSTTVMSFSRNAFERMRLGFRVKKTIERFGLVRKTGHKAKR